MRASFLWFLFYSAELASAASFVPSSNQCVPFVASCRFSSRRNNEKVLTVAVAKITPTETRRRLIQKLASPTAFLVASIARKENAFATVSEVALSPPASCAAVCDPTVFSLTKGDRTLHIVGTAHISSESADLAGRLVRETAPDAVFVELDAIRVSRAFKGGIPPPGIQVAVQDSRGKLQIAVTRKPGFFGRMLVKLFNAASNPPMYRKLERAGISVGEEVSRHTCADDEYLRGFPHK